MSPAQALIEAVVPPADSVMWADGLCVGHPDPDLWHDPETVLAARRICVRCPIVAGCVRFALDDPSLSGVWGGLSDQDRRRIREERTCR